MYRPRHSACCAAACSTISAVLVISIVLTTHLVLHVWFVRVLCPVRQAATQSRLVFVPNQNPLQFCVWSIAREVHSPTKLDIRPQIKVCIGALRANVCLVFFARSARTALCRAHSDPLHLSSAWLCSGLVTTQVLKSTSTAKTFTKPSIVQSAAQTPCLQPSVQLPPPPPCPAARPPAQPCGRPSTSPDSAAQGFAAA